MKRRGRPPYPDLLTPRQQEVLELLRQGLTDREIAERLGISLQGARFHVSEILGKLGVSGRREAARTVAPPRPWWSLVALPFTKLKRGGFGALAAGGAGLLFVGLAAGTGVLAWGVSRAGPNSQAVLTPQVADVTEPGLYVVRPDGSGLRRLRGPADSDAAAWSPSGDRFALTSGCGTAGELLVGTAEGDLERLATLDRTVVKLDWSPDGKTIAVTLGTPRYGGSGVVFVDVATGNVTTVEGDVFDGWSYDGRRYAVLTREGVKVVTPESGETFMLPYGPSAPLWSSTEDRLAFTTVRPEEPPYNDGLESGIDVINGDGSGRSTLLPLERHAITRTAIPLGWSRDGRKLFVASGLRHYLLYDLDAPGEPVDLGSEGDIGFLGAFALSPDFTTAAVLGPGRPLNDVGLVTDEGPLHLVNLVRDGRRQLIDAIVRATAFSPDGSQLFLKVQRASGNETADLFVADVAEGAARMLARLAYDGEQAQTLKSAAWSPSSDYILFSAGPVYSEGCSSEQSGDAAG